MAHLIKVHIYKCNQCESSYSKEEELIAHKLHHIKQIPLAKFISSFKVNVMKKIMNTRASQYKTANYKKKKILYVLHRRKQLTKSQLVHDISKYDVSTDDEE